MSDRPVATSELEATITEFNALEDEIATLEEALKEKKARAKYLGENVMVEQVQDIDGALDRGVTLSDGTAWRFEKDLKCGIPTKRKPEAFSWLATKNADGMLRRYIIVAFPKDSARLAANLKTAIARLLPQYEIGVRVGRAPDELADAIKKIAEAAGLLPTVTITEELELPGPTLTSFVKKQLAAGQNLPECFGVYAPLRAHRIEEAPE
jgi:hypothetical protein